MIMDLMQSLTFVLGMFTTGLSLFLALKFYVVRHELSFALAMMLLAEGIAGAVTVAFSLNSLLHTIEGIDPSMWNAMTPIKAIALRWLLFVTAGVTSAHLYITLEKIMKGEKK